MWPAVASWIQTEPSSLSLGLQGRRGKTEAAIRESLISLRRCLGFYLLFLNSIPVLPLGLKGALTIHSSFLSSIPFLLFILIHFFSLNPCFSLPPFLCFFCSTAHSNQQNTLVFDESMACNWLRCQTLCGEILKVNPHFYWSAAKKTFFPPQIFTQLRFHDIGSAALFWMSLLVRLSRKTVITAVDGDTVQTCAGIGWLDSARIFTS